MGDTVGQHPLKKCNRQLHQRHLREQKKKKNVQKQTSEQPVKISMAVMFVDEGVVKTAEAALLLNSCRVRDSGKMEGRKTLQREK